MARKSGWRLLLLAVVIGLTLSGAGCISLQKINYVDTETSQAIYDAASALVLSQNGRITADALVSGLGNEFPGLKLEPNDWAIQSYKILVIYQEKHYNIACQMDLKNVTPVKSIGIVASSLPVTTPVTSIVSVQEQEELVESDKSSQ
jgi:hypothetical protein